MDFRHQLLLTFHESGLHGGHTSARDTLLKIAKVAWWPTMERDCRDWVRKCAVCRLSKPQPHLTPEQRSELELRPFLKAYDAQELPRLNCTLLVLLTLSILQDIIRF